MKANLKEKLKKAIKAFKLRQEASTTGTMAVATGGVQMGGDIGTTPFAFSKKGVRPSVVHQAGFTPAKKIKASPNYKLENQVYSEPAYISPAQNIEPVNTYVDKNGLVQHNDPDIDPNLVGFKQGSLPMYEISYKNLYEGVNGLKYEQDSQTQPPPPQQPTQSTPKSSPQLNVTSYDVQPDFTTFDQKLKNSTENLKVNLQKNIQDKILGKKIVVRASKGYKQPEADYTINVTGVNIDYYYDRYVIIIVGREENKQKVAKFFIKPGFKIKILGNADNLKPKDQYQMAKSKALVDPQLSSSGTNNVTSDEDDQSAPSPKEPTDQSTSVQPNQSPNPRK
jgi:hypothetical protein